jgi:hypothetical protein
MRNPGQHFIISESFSSLKVFFYTAVIFSHLYIPWIQDFNIIANTPNLWVLLSEHFHLYIESILYLFSRKSLATTAVIKVFILLNYYSRCDSMCSEKWITMHLCLLLGNLKRLDESFDEKYCWIAIIVNYDHRFTGKDL